MIELSYKEFENIIRSVYNEVPADPSPQDLAFYEGWKAATSRIATSVLNRTVENCQTKLHQTSLRQFN